MTVEYSYYIQQALTLLSTTSPSNARCDCINKSSSNYTYTGHNYDPSS